MFGLTKFGTKSLSPVNYPFTQSGITGLSVHFSKGIFTSKWSASGSVTFENGNTNGEQKFKGETFDDVVVQMQEFIKSLER